MVILQQERQNHLTYYQLIVTILIDQTVSGVFAIKLNTKSKKQEVISFLDELKTILEKDDFNIDTNFTLISKEKKEEDKEFSTPYTLLDLDYDINDVIERLKELTVEEYSETVVDKDDLNPPLLFIFGKNINNKQVFVKLKVKREPLGYVVCVSFHYAKWRMSFPYM